MQYKNFGKTGHQSSRTIFGAFALSECSQAEADKTLDLILEYGINHIDTAASYGNSELRIGPWMKEHRKDFFLATKSENRTYKEAKEQLHQSLDRLKTDSIDLWQMHYLVNPAQWETAFSDDGAIHAFIEARDEGLVKYIGVTGHGLAAPRMHIKSLEKFDFDSVLVPYNFVLMQNPLYTEEFNKLLNICVEKEIAVQTIKSLAKGLLTSEQAKHNVWYNPITDDNAISNSVNWVLGNPNVFLNTPGDINLLTKVLDTASKLTSKPDDSIMLKDVEKHNITSLFKGDEE
ncbi:MAG: aldo/keto reductase [Melioribacteraceae bacterium]|nr:aldo/keto reductase [Melioribacteraceae bacterium]